ncbi:sugar ABC transporter permease [Peribacillus psychrosaccharolyticus]|uniref:Sugar ABC transporter permease n=1 Tax=Peribacillus psychrosaccharolyticus TaxID=1407 RepID=A0A974NP32_PERPY|nr:ABC transporter permease subunit [Peribacillus psychrosaccharolyticus]MEC2053949.1 ABC transporter permease subunit [Peribacillus psychrosaccharolyticus]MED3742437.1 ABC transporter permease subunit [Peribacillus psychrosaccharolyticus]QQT01397.1 sugar ABC transporter permease [Peribacillus psychrosaccharolyticus]
MREKRLWFQIKRDWVLYAMLLPALLYFSIFHVIPLIGMKLAFQDYRIIGDNVWVGLKHFNVLFSSPAFLDVLKNTIIISSMKVIFFFPVPIILSLIINEVRNGPFRKYVQSVIYLPHFLSWVVITGVWISLLSPVDGGINVIRNFFQLPSLDYMTSKDHIRWVLVISETWRSAGWDSIIYLAAIMKISPGLYEAAKMDGATSLQQMRYITIPELLSTVVTVFILNLGFFMNAGFDQVFNMINDSVISVIDILDTYVYRIGILNGQYAYATAASLFKGVIGVVLILSTHFISKKVSGKGVW